jgi:hypothetical protein
MHVETRTANYRYAIPEDNSQLNSYSPATERKEVTWTQSLQKPYDREMRKRWTTKFDTTYQGFFKIVMAKAARNKKRDLFTSKMEFALSIPFHKKKFLNKKKIKLNNWQCCLTRRPREANIYFSWSPLEAGRSILRFSSLFTRCLWTVPLRKKLSSAEQ